MNHDIIEGKWKTLKGESKIWWGHQTGDALIELDGNKDNMLGWLQEHKGLSKIKAEKAVEKISTIIKELENQSDHVTQKIKLQFNKLSDNDIDEIDYDIDAFISKVEERYKHTHEEASEKVKTLLQTLANNNKLHHYACNSTTN